MTPTTNWIQPQPPYEAKPYRYTATCWEDDCPSSLDTYGGEEVIAMAQEHADQFKHTITVQVKATIEVRPS